MSQAALDALDKIMLENLQAQRTCSWCGHKATSWQELLTHIEEEHPKDEEGART